MLQVCGSLSCLCGGGRLVGRGRAGVVLAGPGCLRGAGRLWGFGGSGIGGRVLGLGCSRSEFTRPPTAFLKSSPISPRIYLLLPNPALMPPACRLRHGPYARLSGSFRTLLAEVFGYMTRS